MHCSNLALSWQDLTSFAPMPFVVQVSVAEQLDSHLTGASVLGEHSPHNMSKCPAKEACSNGYSIVCTFWGCSVESRLSHPNRSRPSRCAVRSTRITSSAWSAASGRERFGATSTLRTSSRRKPAASSSGSSPTTPWPHPATHGSVPRWPGAWAWDSVCKHHHEPGSRAAHEPPSGPRPRIAGVSAAPRHRHAHATLLG